MTLVTGHQPNFMPYSGFWYKMAKADYLDLRIQYQFTAAGYIHRVKMRDKWFTLPLVPKPGQFDRIDSVRVDLPKAKAMFRNTIEGRYGGAHHYKTRGKDLIERFDAITSDYLWQINLEMLMHVRDVLGIETPICLGVEAIGGKGDGVLSTLRAYPGTDGYLSGNGARKYMGDTSSFDEAGIKVIWSSHEPITHDSIVTLLMDYNDPMDFVMREKALATVD